MGQNTKFRDVETGDTPALADLMVSIATSRSQLTLQPDWHIGHELHELVERVPPHIDAGPLRTLAEDAVERGIVDAHSWVWKVVYQRCRRRVTA